MALHRSIFVFTIGFATLFVSSRAQAADWYVDSVGGSDSNNGDSSASAWKTITHALTRLSSSASAETIHLAPGSYNTANGEVFPLVVRDKQSIIGDDGAASTIVVADGISQIAFRISADPATNSNGVSRETVLSSMTIRDSVVGVGIYTGNFACDPNLRDLVIENCTVGIGVYVFSATGAGTASASPLIEGARLESNELGLYYYSAGTVQGPDAGVVYLRDSTIEDSDIGIEVSVKGRRTALEVDRTRILKSLTQGIYATGSTPVPGAIGTSVVLRDSILARNRYGGLRLYPTVGSVSVGTVLGCTFADNVGYGVRENGGMFTIANSIAWGNHSDIEIQPYAAVSHCDFGNGNYTGFQGSIQADPAFMDAANGDYRLRFGSPCIDAGDPTTSSLTDFAGTPRPLDGDLDTASAPDMGAFEFETLHFSGAPALGRRIGLELFGSTGSNARLYFAPTALTGPRVTPFGAMYLDPGQTQRLETVPALPGPGYLVQRIIPNDPSLVGMTFSFQALTDSSLSPLGQAFTNPISFVIVP